MNHLGEELLGPTLSVGEFVQFFGSAVTVKPPSVTLDFGGRGGGEILIATVQVVRGVVGTLKAVDETLTPRIHAAQRKAAGDWVDTEELTLELRQMVNAQAVWERETFEKLFGLDRRDASLLLKAVGYERAEHEDGSVFWFDPDHRERIFGRI